MQTAERRLDSFSDSSRHPLRISPNVRELNNRRRDLGFSLDSGGLPYLRVLLATDRSLFDPRRAHQRNANNFYDSMSEGMLPYDGPHTYYLVPRAVLRSLQPARTIYYTFIAYEDAYGQRPSYCIPPEELPIQARSISVAADFQPQSLGFMLGTPVEKLTRLSATVGPHSEPAPEETGKDLGLEWSAAASDENASEPDESALAWAESDEEGYDIDPPGQAASLEFEDQAESFGEDYDDGYGALDSIGLESAAAYDFEPGEDADSDALGQAAALDAGLESTAYDADDYDDGFSDLGGISAYAHDDTGQNGEADYLHDAEAAAYGLESQDSSIPGMLYDEDADAQGAATYGHEHDADAVEIGDEPAASAHGFGTYGDEAEDSYESYEAAAAEPSRTRFDIEARKAILARIMPFESGPEGFGRIGADGEFEGRYGPKHPAYQTFHLGLTFGGFPFVQENGTLGKLLGKMRERDPAGFNRAFGANAALLLQVTQAPGPHSSTSSDGLSPRLSPVDGALLWREPWLARFHAAGGHPPFQGAQNEMAALLWIEPMLDFARNLGLTTDRTLTLVVDRAVQMGVAGSKRWITEAVNPVQTPAQLQQALAALGHPDLAALQAASGLPATGEFNADTKACLIAALRKSGRSPVPIPHPEQMADAMLLRAADTPWSERMRRLRDASAPNVDYQF